MSNETKWTKGPWRVGTHGPNGCYTVGTVGGLMTAMVAHSVNHEDQRELAIGDAHLIAAAPDGYALAELVMEICGNPKGVSEAGQEELYEVALQYAKKARGEQS